MFQIYEYLKDYNIDYMTEGHKHCQPGWVQMECPFCTGHEGFHLGFNEQSGVFNCWRCGPHPLSEVLKQIHGINWRHEVGEVYTNGRPYPHEPNRPSLPRKTEIELPKSFLPINDRNGHNRICQYLKERQFDWRKLTKEWDLHFSGPVGNYAFRVIAPIYYQDKIVSYQGRDYTGKAQEKYKACRMEDEAVHHKHTLYGLNKAIGDTVVVVEGITDVWRLGPGAVATFGIKYTNWQIMELKRFKRIVVFFDNDPQAVHQAKKMVAELSLLRPECSIERWTFGGPTNTVYDCDPAGMSQTSADSMMNCVFS